MSETCPISFVRIDEKVARLNAFLIFCCVAGIVFASATWPIYFLWADFLIRVTAGPAASPLTILNKALLAALKVEPKMIDAAPKLFAARMAFVMCTLLAACQLMGYSGAVKGIGYIFLFCSGLETFFAYCLGCKLYSLMHKAKSVVPGAASVK